MTILTTVLNTDAGVAGDVTRERCLFVGPDMARSGGAAYHMRQIFRWIKTPRVAFATFGRMVTPDVAERISEIIHIEKDKWTGYPAATARLSRYLRDAKPAATIAFGIQPLLVAWAAFRLTGHRGSLAYIEITRPWEAFCKVGWGPRTYANDWLLRRALSRCDIVTANCTDGLEELRRHYHVPVGSSWRVHNLLDFSEFPPAKTDYRITGPASLITTSRLVADKGLEDLVEAVARLAVGRDIRLTILGDGPIRGDLERLAIARGVADRISFPGWVNPPFPRITASDLFVFPSHYEGFPNSVLEPMGLGVPVVTSFWGSDARQLVAEGAMLGHEVGDVAGLASRIDEALASERLRESLAKQSQEAAAHYDSRTGAAEYDALFAKLAEIAARRGCASGA